MFVFIYMSITSFNKNPPKQGELLIDVMTVALLDLTVLLKI